MNLLLNNLLASMWQCGIKPERIVLFGSYPKGKALPQSDIDVAVWSDSFSGNRIADIEKVRKIISKFKPVELHPFNMNDNASNNPFVNEIEKTGIDYSFLIQNAKSNKISSQTL